MEVKRNDPCFCGSGRKYKKCCMKNAQIVQLQQLREERFEELKQQFTKQIKNFVYKNTSSEKIREVKNSFQDRFKVRMLSSLLNTYFDMWVVFFYRFDNGKRGVEWFYEENEKYLARDEQDMLKNWIGQTPRLLETVKRDQNGISFQDCFTKEVFIVAETRGMEFAPWQGTFGFIQNFNDTHYVHELCGFREPELIENAKVEINRLMTERDSSFKEVMINDYPEILFQLLQHDLKKENEMSTIEQFILSYSIPDKEEVISTLFDRNDILIDNWDETTGLVTWIGDWYCYEDSEAGHPVYIAEAFAQIHIKGENLYVDTFLSNKNEQFETWMRQFKTAVLVNKEIKKHEIPKQAKALSFSVKTNEQNPRYFTLFAQSRMLTEGLNEPLELFNGKTPKDMAADGELGALEGWLKQHEYNKYIQVKSQFGVVEQTEDINWMRKELGLPLSPFVTNSKERKTTFTLFEKLSETIEPPVSLETTSFFEDLGFSAEEAKAFYAKDIVDFFKEKTDGKAQATVKKYEKSLSFLIKGLLSSPIQFSSWNDCPADFWSYLLQYNYLNNNNQVSVNQAKAVISTVKAFAKWLDDQYDAKQVNTLKSVLTEVEQNLYNSISFFDVYVPFSVRKSRPQFDKELYQKETKPTFSSDEGKVKGMFKVIEKTSSSVKAVPAVKNEAAAATYTITISDKVDELVHKGMVLDADIEKDHMNLWKISDVKAVYPNGAISYINKGN